MTGSKKKKNAKRAPCGPQPLRRRRRPAQPKTKAARSILGPRTAMPSAVSNSIRATAPTGAGKRDIFDVRYPSIEALSTTKAGHLLQDILISPADSSRFKREAKNWQRYRIVKADIAIVSGFDICSGGYVAAVVSDPAEMFPRDESIVDEVFQNPTSVADRWYMTQKLNPTKSLNRGWLFTDESENLRFHSPGRLILACDQPPSQPGTMRFVASYTVEFMDRTSTPTFTVVPDHLVLDKSLQVDVDGYQVHTVDGSNVTKDWFRSGINSPDELVGSEYALPCMVTWAGHQGNTSNDWSAAYGLVFEYSTDKTHVTCRMKSTHAAGHTLTLATQGMRIYNTKDSISRGSWTREATMGGHYSAAPMPALRDDCFRIIPDPVDNLSERMQSLSWEEDMDE